MDDFKLPTLMAQRLVDGLMGGYKEYLAERKQKQQALTISGAFAWTRSNFIDSKISQLFSQDDTVDSQIDKAGYAWEYPQFIQESDSDRALIIVKNARQVKRNFNGATASIDKNNYLYRLAGINNTWSAAGLLSGKPTDRVVQLELALPEATTDFEHLAEQVSSNFSKFYIVTYEVDNVSKMISDIELTMPNQSKMTLSPIQNLTPLISRSQFQINSEELETIQGDQVPDAAYEQNTLFGYEINTDAENEREAGAE